MLRYQATWLNWFKHDVVNALYMENDGRYKPAPYANSYITKTKG